MCSYSSFAGGINTLTQALTEVKANPTRIFDGDPTEVLVDQSSGGGSGSGSGQGQGGNNGGGDRPPRSSGGK